MRVQMVDVSEKAVRTSGLGFLGTLCGLALVWLFRPSPAWGSIILVLAAAIPMLLSERATCSASKDKCSSSLEIVRLQRLSGLLFSISIWAGVVSFVGFFAPEQIGGFWEVVYVIWPVLLVGGVIFVLRDPKRAAGPVQQIGELLLRREYHGPAWWAVIRIQILKAFFLPLMLSFTGFWVATAERDYFNLRGSLLAWYLLPLALSYLVDVVFGTIGYLFTSERWGSHIRSSDSTWGGWIVALVCYPPFWGMMGAVGLTKYKDGYEWHHWLGASGIWAHAWGCAILGLTAIYAWATVVFGLRFSNLTNRGIIRHGPFRYTKHPAYISKNLSWWLISVPFISSEGVLTATLHCIALLLVNSIYFLRAKTEERHLRADPEYRAYSAWIAEHGLWARFRRALARETSSVS